MNLKDIMKFIEIGHLRKSFKTFIFGVPIIIVGIVILYYTYNLFFTLKSDKKIMAYDLNNSSDIAINAIHKIQQREGGLWVENYIYIDGQKYQLKYTQDGKIKVLKNNKLVDLEKVAGTKTAIINKNNKMYFYTPSGELLDLSPGDILSTDNTIVQIKDSTFEPLESDELITKDKKLFYVDPLTSQTHLIKNGETLNINGTAMKMHSNILKPLINVGSDGSYIAKSVNGDLKYFLKKNGSLIPIDKETLTDGTKVLLDNKLMYFNQGDLFSENQINTGVLTTQDLNKILIGDYIVKMTLNNGYPIYLQKQTNQIASVQRKDIADYTLIYFKKLILQAQKDKLIKFKYVAGIPFIKANIPFVLNKNLQPLILKVGDMVEYNGLTLIVDEKGRFIVLNSQMRQQLKKYPNRLIVVNGIQKLYGEEGVISSLNNNSLVFRAGEPYKYIDGKWVKLTQQDIKSLTNKAKPKIDKKPTKKSKAVKVKKKTTQHNQANPTQSLFIDNNEIQDPDQLVAISASPISVQGSIDTLTNLNEKSLVKQTDETNNSLKDINKLILDASTTPRPFSQSDYTQQNDQASKEAFLAAQKTKGLGNFEIPKSPYYLSAGGIIDATMQSGINSDLPGSILAVINTNVYDSISGNYLLIPTGSKIFGVYSSSVSYGQKRILIAWNKLIFPNGVEMDLAGQQGYDLTAQSGLKAEVDNHYWEVFKDVALMSIFSAASQYAAGGTSGSLNALSFVAASIGQQLSQVGTQLVQKTMNIQPTLKIQQGTKFKILIDHGIYFPYPYKFNEPLNFVLQEQ